MSIAPPPPAAQELAPDRRRPSTRLPDTLSARSPQRRSGWSRLAELPFHPLLFAALFVVYLLAENLDDQVKPIDVLGVLGAVVAASAGLLVVLWALTRNARLAGLITSVAVLWVFLYKFASDVLAGAPNERLELEHWGLIGVAALVVVVGLRAQAGRLTQALNFVAAVLLLLNLLPVVPHQIATASAPTYRPPGTETLSGLPDEVAAERRDIYYLIFDRYPSQTTLMSTVYGFDNSPFLDELERRGFYVADDSRANYIMTALSLASSLNLDYLDAGEMKRVAPNPRDWKPVYDMLAGSLVAPKVLEEQGYTYVQVPSWYAPTAAGAEVDIRYKHEWLSEFATTLLDTTVVPRVLEAAGIRPGNAHIDNALYQFSTLMNLDDMQSPKFVYAHFLLPHPPYVFDSTGVLSPERILPDGCCNPTLRFLEQLQYTNRRILELVEKLTAGPDESDPIIIIQADEGPRPARPVPNWREASQEHVQQKFGILNAYLFPGADADLYPSITPVNSFRVLFNEYFGADLPLLEDRVLAFAGAPNLYDYVDITDRFEARSSDVAASAIEYAASAPLEWTAGQPHEYAVTVTNTGETPWQSDGPDAAALFVQFAPADVDPQMGWAGGQRFDLAEDLAPGASRTIQVSVQAPDLDGTYQLRHRMAHGINWFAPGPQAEITVRTPPGLWQEVLSASYGAPAATDWRAGETRSYEVTVTNTGSYTWNAAGEARVRLGVHFGADSDEPHTEWSTDERFDLPRDVPPGESVAVSVDVTAPLEPGSYRLRHRMVKEGIGWFEDLASTPISVTASAAEPTGPPLLLAAAVAVAVALVAGAAVVARRRHAGAPRES